MQIKKYSTISVKIDHYRESQVRELLSIGCSMIFGVFAIFIYCTEKKYMKYSIHIIYILMHEFCLNFLIWVMIFVVVSYNVYERCIN